MHLLSLVNDLLDLSRIEAGKYRFRTEEVNLNHLCTKAIQMAMANPKAATLSFETTCSQDMPDIHTDRKSLLQIFLNLLSNAIKFTPAGGHIKFDVFSDNKSNIDIRISDNGIGMPPEVISHVFEPFYQAETSYSRTYEGAGLGLTIVNQLVRLQGGEISFISQQGKGTEVHVVMPCHKPS